MIYNLLHRAYYLSVFRKQNIKSIYVFLSLKDVSWGGVRGPAWVSVHSQHRGGIRLYYWLNEPFTTACNWEGGQWGEGGTQRLKKFFFTNFNETITRVCLRWPLFQCLLVHLDVNHWPDWPHLTTGPSVTSPEHFRKLETHTSHLNSAREFNTHILNMILWQKEEKVRKGRQNSSVREGTKKASNLNWIMCDKGGQGHSDIYWMDCFFTFTLHVVQLSSLIYVVSRGVWLAFISE